MPSQVPREVRRKRHEPGEEAPRTEGFAAVGLHRPSRPENIGGVFRAADVYGGRLVVLGGGELAPEPLGHPTDTKQAWRRIGAAPRRPGRLDTAREGARGLQTDTGSDAMRIQIVSDLHLEFGNPVPDLAAGVDIVVLAGDLAEIRHPWLLAEAVQAGVWASGCAALRHIVRLSDR